MKIYLFLFFYFSLWIVNAQNKPLGMYHTVIVDKRKITFEYKYFKNCYKLQSKNRKQFFNVEGKEIYIQLILPSNLKDSLSNHLLQFIGQRYETPIRPPSTFPIVNIGFVVNEWGQIMDKGFCLGSTDENFNRQIFEILATFDYQFAPTKLLNTPVGFLICISLDFYQLLDFIQRKK
jgi:hypothetical protein